MSSYILHEGEKSIVLRGAAADALLRRGDGDAALLYLALMRAEGAVSPRELQKRLGWSELRLAAAETALQELGLIDRPAPERVPAPAEERPAYTAQDMAQFLEDRNFVLLQNQMQQVLGKKLNSNDLQILANLYDAVGLPADVIYQMTVYGIERMERRFGPGRRPTLRQLEKEGYYWARRGIFTPEAAARYMTEERDRLSGMHEYMRVLQLGDRLPVESEEKYLREWIDMGFTPEAVALAYDKTIFYKKDLNWSYLGGILRRWHKNGWHTEAEIRAGDKPKKKGGTAGKTDWMEKYM